jgi:hypothetical protein
MESNIENINQIFYKMKENGWDTTQPLKWGFFFIGQHKKNLIKIYEELKDYSYTLENIHQTDDGVWVLQASKTEALLPDKLHQRNISFNDLAIAYDSIYDGWDVGQA